MIARRLSPCWLLAPWFAAAVFCAVPRASAQVLRSDVPRQAQGLEVTEHLGEILPLDTEFVDDATRKVRLYEYFGPAETKPAIVAMVYYRCPVVCSVVMSKIVESLNQVDFTPGREFRVLLFSVKDEETVIDAAGAKARYLEAYSRAANAPEVRDGWRFHVGTPDETRRLADALGFSYKREANGEYAHPVAIFIATPQGKISRYLYGFDYRPETVKMALLEASNGAIGKTIGERFMPFCYRYDPAAGTYTLQAFKLMRIGGVVTMVLVFGLVVALRVHEGVRRRRAARVAEIHAPAGTPPDGAAGTET